MARDTEFLTFVLDEVLREVPGVTYKSMFSGFGLYVRGVVFGLIIGNILYFKTDTSNISDYAEHLSHPFQFRKKSGKEIVTSSWAVPEEIMEDSEEVVVWVEKAYEASLRKRTRD